VQSTKQPGKNYLSPITIQLNPFWNICDEHNITVYTECHEGKGLSFLAPRFVQLHSQIQAGQNKSCNHSGTTWQAATHSDQNQSKCHQSPTTQYLELLDNITNKTRKTNDNAPTDVRNIQSQQATKQVTIHITSENM